MARRKQAERAAAEAMKARRAYYQHIRSHRQRRQMLYAFGPILAVVLGLVGYGYYTFQYARPRQPVARVMGQAITASTFSQRLQYSRRQVLNNVRQLTGMISTDQSSFITDYANSQRSGVVQSTLDALIDEVLIQKEADVRGLEVSDQEVHDEICRQLQEATRITSPSDATATAVAAEAESPTAQAAAGDAETGASEAVTDTAAITETGLVAQSDAITATDATTASTGAGAAVALTETDAVDDDAGDLTATDAVTAADGAGATDATTGTGAAALPTDTPKPACELSEVEFDRAFDELYVPALTEAGMTRATYDNLVRMNLYREALNKAMGAEVVSTAEQVEVQYLVFGDDAAAVGAAALADAKAGTAWDALVGTYGPRAVNDETAGSPTAGITETVTADGATATFQTDPAVPDATGATTDTESTDATGATTTTGATGAITPTATTAPPTATPAPTATPNPYAVTKSDDATWYTKESMKAELGFIDADVDKVFALASGKPAETLIKGSQGNYLIVVLAKDAARTLPEADLQTKRDGALEEWLKKTRTEKSAEISKFPIDIHTPPEPQWYIDGFAEIVGGVTGQPTLDIAGMMTQQPVGTPAP